MRSYVKCYTGEPEQFKNWINQHCQENKVRVTAMTMIPSSYGAKIMVAFETIEKSTYVWG